MYWRAVNHPLHVYPYTARVAGQQHTSVELIGEVKLNLCKNECVCVCGNLSLEGKWGLSDISFKMSMGCAVPNIKIRLRNLGRTLYKYTGCSNKLYQIYGCYSMRHFE
jgi:hypothetical protein